MGRNCPSSPGRLPPQSFLLFVTVYNVPVSCVSTDIALRSLKFISFPCKACETYFAFLFDLINKMFISSSYLFFFNGEKCVCIVKPLISSVLC